MKKRFEELKNPASAQALIDFYGNDLRFVRQSMVAEMSYLSWALISNACNLGFVAANSPYMAGLANMDYAVDAWQKDAVATSWADSAAEILDDIQGVIDEGETYGKEYLTLTVNKTWFTHIRNNEQVQKYAATMVQNLFSTQAPPTLEAINAMFDSYFNMPVRLEVVDEKVTRASLTDVKTTANPFQDGVAVFSLSNVLGHFEWNGIPIINPTSETRESFFTVGSVTTVNPNLSEIYAKGRGFPVIDTYADNFYLKINAVAWA